LRTTTSTSQGRSRPCASARATAPEKRWAGSLRRLRSSTVATAAGTCGATESRAGAGALTWAMSTSAADCPVKGTVPDSAVAAQLVFLRGVQLLEAGNVAQAEEELLRLPPGKNAGRGLVLLAGAALASAGEERARDLLQRAFESDPFPERVMAAVAEDPALAALSDYSLPMRFVDPREP